jgi:hypothetical protein
MTPVDLMARCTARILAGSDANATSMGTGFFYGFPNANADPGSCFPALVTNKHVLDGCSKAQIVLSVAPANAPKDSFDRPQGLLHEAFDIPINANSPIFNNLEAHGRAAHHFLLTQSLRLDQRTRGILRTVEPVVMVGYPNGLWDATNNAPIIRRGITATHPLFDYGGRSEFVIDAACFPGSSGSPVFIYEDGMYRSAPDAMSPGTRVALVGVLWGGPQYTAEGVLEPRPIPHNLSHAPVTNIPMNLGFVIAADQLDQLAAVIHARGIA